MGGNGAFTYEGFGSMTSGSHDTTLRNSALNLLTGWIALREFGMSVHQAKHHLPAVFGDDNANNQIVTTVNGVDVTLGEVWVRVASELRLKLEITPRTDGVIGYLSRYYSFDARGVTGSMVDLGRQLPKFQFLARRNATKDDFRLKFSSLLMLVGTHTPVLSAYVEAWFRVNS